MGLDFWESKKLEIGIALAGLVLVGVGVFWWKTGGGEQDRVEILSAATEVQSNKVIKQQITVDVEGAVNKPGVYRLDLGARVGDLVATAGGMTADADTKWIEMNLNRAGKLTDGAKFYIPYKSEILNPKFQINSNSQISNLININTGSQAELESLPGVGPVTAGKIINSRPYGDINELLEKKIVGQKVWGQIKDAISL